LEAHVRFLGEDCQPRHHLARENQAKAIAYITARLREAGGRIEVQEFSTSTGPYQNIIAHFGPEAGPRYVIGAHFDACGIQPGADDNASGVAGMLALARHFAGTKRGRTLRFAAFATLEESPYYATKDMGSFVHAAALKREGAVVRAMISLEMIGYFTDAPGSQRFPHPLLGLLYPSTGDFITVVGRVGQGALVRQVKKAMQRATYLDIYSITAPTRLTGVDFSDHRSFWAHGYRAVMITDTAFYRNDRYHTPRDTADTLDYDRMAEVVRAVHHAVVVLAK